jgi:hypothetical protein
VEINKGFVSTVGTTSTTSIIDYKSKSLKVATGPSSVMELTMDGKKGDLLQVYGHTTIAIDGFVSLEGGFGFEKSSRSVKVYNSSTKATTDVSTSVLVLGMADVNAFAGVKGAATDGSEDIGLNFTNVDFALAMFSEVLPVGSSATARKWTAIDSTIGGASFKGITGLTLAVDNTHIVMNKKASMTDASVIDFKAMQTAGAAFVATTGVNAAGETQTVTFSIDGKKGDMLQVYGHATVNLFDIASINGGFGFEKSSRMVKLYNVSTTTATEVMTDIVAFGMTDVNTLIGTAGTASDGSEDVGIRFTHVDLALVSIAERTGAARKWTAVSTNIGGMKVLGISGVTLGVESGEIIVNKKASPTDATVVDFKAMQTAGNAFQVVTGVDSKGVTKTVTFAMDGKKGDLLKVQADVSIAIGDYVNLNGIVGFEKSTSQIKVTNKAGNTSQTTANVLTISGGGLNAFVGVDRGANNALGTGTGLELTDVSFTLGLFNESINTRRSWVALEASAGSVAVLGLGDDLTVSASAINISLNNASTLDSSVVAFDQTKTLLGLTFGSPETAILAMKGTDGQYLKASANFDIKVSSFFKVSGILSLEMSTQRVVLATSGTVKTDMFAFGGGGLNAFVGVGDVGLNLTGVSFQLGLFKEKNSDGTPILQNRRYWTALKASADSAALTGMGTVIEASGTNLKVAINMGAMIDKTTLIPGSPVDKSAINFQKTTTDLGETIGSAETKILDMATAGVQASGSVSLKAFSVIKADATLVFERSQQNVTLTTGDSVDVDVLTIGAVDINAFVGSIPKDSTKYADRVGFEVKNLDLAMMIMTEHLSAEDIANKVVARKWSALKAAVDSVGFIGIKDVTVGMPARTDGKPAGLVEVNYKADRDASLVDFTASPITINPPGASGGVTFDIKKTTKNYLAISGSFELGFFDFFSFQKDMLIELTFESVTLNNANRDQVMTQMLSFGKSNINAFAGINKGTADAMGFTIENAAVGFGIFIDMTNPTRFWVAGKAEASKIGFVGPAMFQVTTEQLTVAVNTAASDGTSIDFSGVNNGQGFAIPEGIGGMVTVGGGGTAVSLNMKGETISAAGSLKVKLFDFVNLSGNFAFEKSVREISLYNPLTKQNSTARADMISFGGHITSAFAGYQGDMSKTSDDIGFSLTNMDFAFVYLADKGDIQRKWTAVNATIGSIGFVGIPGVGIGGSNINFLINSASYDNLLVDFKTTPITIGASAITLNLDPKLGAIIRFGGTFEFSMFDFVKIKKDFTITQQLKNVQLDDKSFVSVAMMTIAYTNLDLYAGVNEYTDTNSDLKDDNGDFMGLRIEDINFGAVLAYGVTTGDAYFSFQGEASNIGLVGVDWLDISAQHVQVAFNMSTNINGRVIDYKGVDNKNNLVIPQGIDLGSGTGVEGDPFIMTLDGSLKQIIEVDVTGALLKISSFVYLSGNFAFKKGGPISLQFSAGMPINPYVDPADPSRLTKLLNPYSTAKFDYLSVAASNVNVFVGMNGPYFGLGDPGSAVGIYAGNINVAFAMFSTSISETSLYYKNLGLKFMSLNAHISDVGLVGFGDVFKATFKDISLQVNIGSDNAGTLQPWVDFKKSFGDLGFAVPTGAAPVYLDFDNYVLAAGIGLAEIQVSEFLQLRGSLAFTMGQQFASKIDMGGLKTIVSDIATGFETLGLPLNDLLPGLDKGIVPLNLQAITLGGANLTGFVGIGGPYRYGDDLITDRIKRDESGNVMLDADGNAIYEQLPIPDGLPDIINGSATGLVIDDVDFGIAVMSPTIFTMLAQKFPMLAQMTPKFITAKAHVGYAGLVGVDPSILSAKLQDVEVNINTFYWPMPHAAAPQAEAALRALEAGINIAAQLFGPPSINYKASFPNSPEDKNKNGVLDLYDEDRNLNGTFDLGEDLGNGILDPGEDLDGDGILDTGEDLGNGILDPGEDFDGDDILDKSEDLNRDGIFQITEDLNRDGQLAPYGYALWAGGNNAVIFDFESEIIQAKIGYAELNLGGFLQLSASMAITKRGSEEVYLSNGEKTTVTSLALGISDANGFIGVPSFINDIPRGYFYDSNGDHRITTNEDKDFDNKIDPGEDKNNNGILDIGDTTNPDAVGVVIENFNLGVIIAKELVIGAAGLKVGMYLAVHSTLDKIGLVGLDDVPVIFNARDLSLDLNVGMRFTLSTGVGRTPDGKFTFDLSAVGVTASETTIDFSKSTWMDTSLPVNRNTKKVGDSVVFDTSDDIVNPGYAVETGDPAHPVVLTFKNKVLRVVVGTAEIQISEFLYLRGSFVFQLAGKYKVDVDLGGLETLADNFGTIFPGYISGEPVEMEVEALTFGGSNLSGFAGIGGPYRYGDDLFTDRVKLDVNGNAMVDDNGDTIYERLDGRDGLPDNINENAVGLVIDDADFGFAVMSPTFGGLIPGVALISPKFLSAKAQLKYAGVVGIDPDILAVNARDVEININTFFLPNDPTGGNINLALQLFGPPSINYKTSFSNSPEDRNKDNVLQTYDEDTNNNGILDAGEDKNSDGVLAISEDLNGDGMLALNGLAVESGINRAVVLDFDEEIIQAKVGYAEINLAGFMQLSASMAFTKKGSETVTLSNGDTTSVTSLAIGISNANGFIGVPSIVDGKPRGYFYDSNKNTKIEPTDLVNDKAVGLAVRNLNFGVVVAKELVIGLTSVDVGVYVAAQANIQEIGLVGVDGVTIKATNLSLDINTGARFSLDIGEITRDSKTGAVSFDADVSVSASLTTIDLSKSGWADEREIEANKVVITSATAQSNGTYAMVGTAKASSDVNIFNAGTYLGTAKATAAGNWTYTTVAPVITSTTRNDDETYALNGTAIANNEVKLFNAGTYIGTVKADSTGHWSYETESSVTVLKPEDLTVQFKDITAKHKGYGIATGNPNAPIVLDYTGQYLRVAGGATLDLFGLVHADGVFDFRLSETDGLTAFVDAEASIGKGSFTLNSHVTGLLVVGKRTILGVEKSGIATRLQLSAGLNLGDFAKLDAALEFTLNSFGSDIVYQVPDMFKDILDNDTATDPTHLTSPAYLTNTQNPAAPKPWEYVISATPTGKPSWIGMYVQLSGKGNLNLLDDALVLDGAFHVIVSESGMEMSVEAQLDLPLFEPLAVTGTLGIVSGGIYGALEIGGTGSESTLIDGGAFKVNGHFLLQLNTTSTVQTVRAINTSGTGGGFVTVNLTKQSLHVAGTATINLLDAIVMNGSMDLTIDSTGVNAQAALSLELGDLGSIAVSGALSFIVDDYGNGPAFALKLATNINIGSGVIGITAAAVLEINTSDTHSYAGVAAGTTFKLTLDGAIHILAFDVSFHGGMSLIDDVFRLEFDGSLDFFGFVTVNVNGFIESDGDFSITGSAGLDFHLGPLHLSAGMSMTFSNTRFAASAYGSLDFELDLGLFDIDFTLAGFSAEIELTAASAYLAASVTVMGISVSGSYLWSWGAPPVISYTVGDTLYLNMGDKPGRYGSGDLYDDTIHEAYSIDQNKDTGALVVRSLGVTTTYNGNSIKHIVANGGSGNDSIYVGRYVTAKLEFDGGAGNDSFTILGGASNSVIKGGIGKDSFLGGVTSGIHYYGEAGDDRFIGGEGAEYIDMGDGTNSILSGGGNDDITITAGINTVNTGDGNNIVRVSGSGTNDITTGNGNNIIYLSGNGSISVTTSDGSNTIYKSGEGSLKLTGGSGFDRLVLAPITSSDTTPLYFYAHQFKQAGLTIDFNDAFDRIEVTDNATVTKLVSGNNATWGKTDFVLDAAGILDVKNATIIAPQAMFSVKAAGIDGILTTQLGELCVVNRATAGAAYSDITVHEFDSLSIVSDNRTNGGLYTANGSLSVELATKESLFSLTSGGISTDVSGKDITIVADDVDFHSGNNMVSGTGKFYLHTKTNTQNYRLGNAAQTISGNDYSTDGSTGYFDFSMQDLAALKDGFNQIIVGTIGSVATMYVGDIKDATFGVYNFAAKLTDKAILNADRINIVGDVQSTDQLMFNARLMDVQAQNCKDPMGIPNSGVLAKDVVIDLTQQLLLRGWIKGDLGVAITVTGGSLVGQMVSYDAEINSITTNNGSSIKVLGAGTATDRRRVTIKASHSVYLGGGIFTGGAYSDIHITSGNFTGNTVESGAGITMLAGSTVMGQYNYNRVILNASDYIHLNPESALLSGAIYNYADPTNPLPQKTGIDSVMDISAYGEMKLSGSILSAGVLNISAGETKNTFAEYFDYLPSQILTELTTSTEASKTTVAAIIAALNNNQISEALRGILKTAHLDLATTNSAVTSLANYVPFASLSDTVKNKIATDLLYTVYSYDSKNPSSSVFYNAESGVFREALTQGALLSSSAGYTHYDGMVFYNPNATSDKQFVYGFNEGISADYSNALIDWVGSGVKAPASGTTFAILSIDQKLVVANALGYRFDYNIIPTANWTTGVIDYTAIPLAAWIAGTPIDYNTISDNTWASLAIDYSAISADKWTSINYNDVYNNIPIDNWRALYNYNNISRVC